MTPEEDKDSAFMERIKLVLETVAKDGLPGPRDLDVAIESIVEDAKIWRGDFEGQTDARKLAVMTAALKFYADSKAYERQDSTEPGLRFFTPILRDQGEIARIALGNHPETGPENSREEMSPVLNGTLDAAAAQLVAASSETILRQRATILDLEAKLDQRNEALLAIKGLCAGEGHPKWSNKHAVTLTRGKILDIVDVTLRTLEKPDAS